MPGWIAAGYLFFLYLLLATPLVRGLPGPRRRRAVAGAAAGLLLCAVAQRGPQHAVFQDWVWPPLVLLTAYWASGLLFAAPMPAAERALAGLDTRLRILHIARSMPRWGAELLEGAYVGVYPLIPIALAVHVLTGPDPDPARFWTVILVVDFVCFGVLPWVQTRPPRALDPAEPWISTIRRFNLRLLGRTSIQVNTFPSGHAAEALAAALLVADGPWPALAWMSANAALISAGAVLGRYHYAADAFAGWMVAIAIWWLL